MPKWKRRYWIETCIVIGVVIALFGVMLPNFFRNQNATKLNEVQLIVNEIARSYAETSDEGVGSRASQYFYDAWAKSRERYFVNDQTSFALSLYHDRIWLDKKRIPLADIQNSDVEIWVDVFTLTEDVSFVVYAWLGADRSFLSATFKNDDLYFAPVLDAQGYYMVQPRYPLYGANNGWGNPGVVYRDSYQAGWRKRPAFLEPEGQP
ncbi:MAG: hypothetical protein P9L94_01150 [Candidatus Hinthialibacter antarcticus]|nr:hypothetical protein [Candidatus Hinthialibacter antarcticus]